MLKETAIVADKASWLTWRGSCIPFDTIDSAADLSGFRTVVLAPNDPQYLKTCQIILDWKRAGQLEGTRLILGTYKGRHLWSPENDALVDQWVVHARSEREVLDSDRLVFVPLCLAPSVPASAQSDDGFVFMGGRKWRELGRGIEALVRSGLPGRVISDFAPPVDSHADIEIRREKVPYDEYIAVMARARVVGVPLKGTPVSHGHVEVVNAIMLGKPVVVTAGASCDDYVEHGVSGLLVSDNSVKAWTEALTEAFAKADALAAGARARAPAYRAHKYAAYLQEVIEAPERHLVPRTYKKPKGAPDRSEWHRSLRHKADHDTKVAHLQAVRSASQLIREERFDAARALLEPCLDGPHRLDALRLTMRIAMMTDVARAEPIIAMLLAEDGDSAELRSNRAASLWAQGRRADALADAREAVTLDPARSASRTRLIAYLRHMRETREAQRVLDDGLTLAPDDPALLRLRSALPGAPPPR